MDVCVTPIKSINGLFSVPGDKSISHRAVILASIAEGKTEIEGFLAGEDCLSTICCMRELGVELEINNNKAIIFGNGLYGLKKPQTSLNVGNSGTTIRLLSGLLAAQPFETEITGDSSICSRPMNRIIEPLELMGAEIISSDGRAPLIIKGNTELSSINYKTKTASAQVKSCILLAGLYCEGETSVTEPENSRNHTEVMLGHMGAKIKTQEKTTTITGKKPLNPHPIFICGDISSAAYLMVAALLLDKSDVTITNVGVNPTRTGIITILREMGAQIEVLHRRVMCGEYVADIRVRSSRLKGIEIGGSIIPTLIDEIPILAVAAIFAEGKTVIKNAEELKVKETNRIDTLVTELKKMGADIAGTADGMIINGGAHIKGARVNSHGDHRIAMSLAIAALNSSGETQIEDGSCADISFPGFFEILNHFI